MTPFTKEQIEEKKFQLKAAIEYLERMTESEKQIDKPILQSHFIQTISNVHRDNNKG